MPDITLRDAHDQVVKLTWTAHPDGSLAVVMENQTFWVTIDPRDRAHGCLVRMDTHERLPFYTLVKGDGVDVWLRGRVYHFKRDNPRRGSHEETGFLPPSGEIRAPMPGTILKHLVKPGQQVEAQAALLVMESMKMEITIPAPVAGHVTRVACQPGQLVEMNALLLTLEALADAPLVS
jgi:acetyl/propionyl-CoA carboxylase alpha subunit